jgi:PadR family transcriptional regulator PadR
MTMTVQLVLQVLLEDPETERYGAQIGEAAGLASGTVHPILARLEAAGWVASSWEDVDPREAGRPARRYYRLTGVGTAEARSALVRAYRPRRVPLTGPAPEAG